MTITSLSSLCTNVLVPSALVTFLSRPSSRRTSPESSFDLNRKTRVFLHRVLSSPGVFSHYIIKQKSGACKQNFWSQRQTEEKALEKKTIPKEVESGRLLLQFTAVHADREAVAGLPDKHREKQDGRFQKIFFLSLFLTGQLKDGGMETSRTLELRCKSQFCHFLAKSPLTSYLFSFQFC